ncbi:DegT/DnrJ/EryC1/StrS family aminotransferase [Sediminibacterium sp.]|uniref:DegT/DnrJ/EryC1/StrS family aminotransferase n=1 Tax=Sediminibacterium sp. TaxID=1917865 RepID=UPI00260093DF|nr:DegT/DnrJ/EryC1/StrS family aminotransferase [Sediminibacterium sp.]
MKVPFVDLKAQYETIKSDIDAAIFNVVNETAFIGGKYVQEFEQAFADKYGVKHCISVANGTDSLFIIMKMLNIGHGDEVITVANSWISSSETISQTGATPVFVDIDPSNYTINEKLIESKITARTKAIIPVHLYGQSCEMDSIISISNKFKIPIIEDCAQSHFTEFKGKRVGTFGIASSFSFYPGKNLGAYGDAGCILTNDSELALKFKMYARHGALKKHDHKIEGINSRMDGLQAAILLAKLPFILEWTNKRIQNANLYFKYLKDNKSIILPSIRENTKHSFHLFVIRTEKRDGLLNYLKENGIETAIHYPVALVNMPAYEYLDLKLSDYPVAMEYQNTILSIPMYPELTEDQIIYISSKINDYFL